MVWELSLFITRHRRKPGKSHYLYVSFMGSSRFNQILRGCKNDVMFRDTVPPFCVGLESGREPHSVQIQAKNIFVSYYIFLLFNSEAQTDSDCTDKNE